MPGYQFAAAMALMLLCSFTSAMAQEGRQGDLTLDAIIGGALPYSTGGGGYMMTRLINPDEDARIIDFARQSPFSAEVKNVFDARPQFGLGARYELGRTAGGAKLALKAMISTAMERPAEGDRPLLGIAGLIVLF
jgi:hypothetical protein